VLDHRVLAVDPGREDEAEPLDPVLPPADPGMVALPLNGVQLPGSLEAGPAAPAQDVLPDGVVSPDGELLGRVDVQVIAEGLVADHDREALQGGGGEP
jgi:hypothetical protein